MTEKALRGLIFQFIASYTLADHLGDVGNDVEKLLNILGRQDIVKKWNDLGGEQEHLAEVLRKMKIKTIWNTDL